MNEDSNVMLAFKKGDEQSFITLLGKYTPRIVNYLYRTTGNAADAEDLAQEVFARVYAAAPRYEPTARFSTWLYTIATNIYRDYIRKQSHAPTAIQATDSDGESTTPEAYDRREKSLEKIVEDLHRDVQIHACLQLLPETQRIALTLKIYENASYEEIAEILHTTVPAVESLLFRARQQLKKQLSD
ncbi:MAG: sigma-70 family RNA polymerase sigma factor [Elusimicrobia bacterium]|nr:sigma-70 family RNA polymerase sigma factor [Elusimicrobiota bacterium]